MLNHWYYLLSLLLALSGLAVLDWRYRLAFWSDRGATLLTLGIGLAIFIVWDICGIQLSIFRDGGSRYMLPLRIYKNFPIEELFFLTLLCYQTLILYRAGGRLWPRT